MKKYENKQVDGKVSKENKDTTRNLCFHDWLIVRELKVLDDAYDDMLKQVNYRVLNLCDIEDSDERQQKYDKLLEERETLRAIYIQRRNELKAGFTDRQEHQDGEVNEKRWRKSRIERLSDVARSGYLLSDKETKAVLNKRSGWVDVSADFEGDDIMNIKDKAEGFEFHKYTPEELEAMGITKGTFAKGRLHPDDVGKELTIDMLNRVIWESAEEDE